MQIYGTGGKKRWRLRVTSLYPVSQPSGTIVDPENWTKKLFQAIIDEFIALAAGLDSCKEHVERLRGRIKDLEP